MLYGAIASIHFDIGAVAVRVRMEAGAENVDQWQQDMTAAVQRSDEEGVHQLMEHSDIMEEDDLQFVLLDLAENCLLGWQPNVHMAEVLLDYGLEGYGLYWYCLELIVSKVDKDNVTFELENDSRMIAKYKYGDRS